MNVPNRVKFASGMILAAEADGIALRLEGMRVIISGGQETVNRWRESLSQYSEEILQALGNAETQTTIIIDRLLNKCRP